MSRHDIPSLDSLKTQAKTLLKALKSDDPAAQTRLRAAFASKPVEERLAHCLHVIAVENGFQSWPKLKFAVESIGLDREERVSRLGRALMNGAFHIVDRLLEIDPTLPEGRIGLQIALYDAESVVPRLQADPTLAVKEVGPRRPILHLAFSKWHQRRPELRAPMLAIAETLVACGVDVNDSFRMDEGSEPLSALYGALGHADNLMLAEWLLLHGADPNDGESLYHAAELGHLDGLRLLMAHGVRTRGTNAFYRMLDFDSLEGARLMLDYGADPNEPIGQGSGPAPELGNTLHHAIRRGRDGRFAELLLAAGADPDATCFGLAPYALARAVGNRSMAQALERLGQAAPLPPEAAFLAACSEGDRKAMLAARAADPDIAQKLHPQLRSWPMQLAMRPGQLERLELLAEAGFDFDLAGDSGLTPLQSACWFGRAEYLPFLLSLKPDLTHRNMHGGDAVGTTIHGSANCPAREQGDYVSTLAQLFEAGATLSAEEARGALGGEEVTAFLEERLEGEGR